MKMPCSSSCEPGFSTAGAITQQAGRGVGMDVVATEIKRLGGALHMETKPGQGTVFTIRLPFTLAISHALVVRTGDEFYALPLPTVEGVLRLSKAEVLAHLGKDASTFDYGGQKYRFQHLRDLRRARAFSVTGAGRHDSRGRWCARANIRPASLPTSWSEAAKSS